MNETDTLNALLRTNLPAFVEKVFSTVAPGQKYHRNWHIQAICHQLERCRRGECKRLLITMPPRCLKSISASVAFPAYLLGHDPSAQVMCISYGQDLSAKHGNDMRHVMEQIWYEEVFPKTQIKSSTQAYLKTTKMGSRISTSVGGAITGLGAEIIIVDDAHKADEGASETKREQVIEWYRSSLLSRLNNKEEGVIIVIQQRLHEEDLAGYLIEKGGFVHLNLPAVATEKEKIPIGDNKFITRLPGDLLDKYLLSQAVLDQVQAEMGGYAYAAQYLQEPAPIGGGMVKTEWFKYYKNRPAKLNGDRIVQSWDTAMTANDSSDYSVCTTWHVKATGEIYLLHVYRKKLEYPQLYKESKRLIVKYKPDVILIEASAAGTPLFQDLRQYPELRCRLFPIKPQNDKVTRMYTQTPVLESGIVYLDKLAVWLPEFQRELSRFPKTKHDDQVDSVSQFLYYYRSFMLRRNQMQCIVTPIYSDSHLPNNLFTGCY
jgi:predicted phage terminase large subunit-like protein